MALDPTPLESIQTELEAYVEGLINHLRTKAGLPPAEANAPLRWREDHGWGGLRHFWTGVQLPGTTDAAQRVEVHIYPGEVGIEHASVSYSVQDLDDGDYDAYTTAIDEGLELVWKQATRAAGIKPPAQPDPAQAYIDLRRRVEDVADELRTLEQEADDQKSLGENLYARHSANAQAAAYNRALRHVLALLKPTPDHLLGGIP